MLKKYDEKHLKKIRKLLKINLNPAKFYPSETFKKHFSSKIII